MNKQKVIIESLAMDLKRLALGLYRGSYIMADKFRIEALKREGELKTFKLDSSMKNLLAKSENTLRGIDKQTAEDALMFSTLFQNYAVKKFH